MTYGAKKYKQTDVLTASPGKILILLYEAAIRHIRRAIVLIDKGDIAGKGLAIGKAHDIVSELVNTLNFEVGNGDIARELERLYNFMIEQLLLANSENSKEKLEGVSKLLETLLEGWRGAVDQVHGEAGK